MNLDSWLDGQLQGLRERQLFREIPSSTRQQILCFCSNDYLGFSQHPGLRTAARNALETYGTSSGASRLISGTLPVHTELEKEIARWQNKEAALLFNSGYHANTGIIPAVAKGGTIFSDELNHASLIDGCRLSKAKIVIYRHNDTEYLETLLSEHQNHFPKWIVAESVFSMEGEQAPLAELVRLKKQYGAFFYLDEAHGVGLYGEKGGGLSEELNLSQDVDVVVGTFSKALGGFGAFAAGSARLIAFLLNSARSFIFSSALPPAVVASNMAAIHLVSDMQSSRQALRQKSKDMRVRFCEAGFSVKGFDSPILPLVIGEPEQTLTLSRELAQQGIWVQAIRPPTVPPGTSRLRITLSLSHSQEDCERLFSALSSVKVSAC